MLGKFMFICLWGPLNLFRLSRWWRWHIVDLEHLPPPGVPTVVVVNHIHWTDVHVVGASLPLARWPWWIAKSELFKSRLLAWALRQLHVIPVRRGKSDIAALQAAEQVLRTGELVVVFPEGHRSEARSLIQGRGGAVRIALRSGAVIVPAAVWGTERGFLRAMLRSPVTLRFGEPYLPVASGETIGVEEMAALTEAMMVRIGMLLPEQYHGMYREQIAAARAPQVADG